MPRFRLSRRAEADLLDIAAYTLRTWGEGQTVRYLNDLESCCRMLGDQPAAGRSCEAIRPGLLRIEQGRHVVFYRRDHGGVLVIRILHQRMLPERHALGSEHDES